MKESLAHLPERKRHELARIVSIIRDSAPQAEMIILFGSYARGDAVEDVTTDGHTTYEYSSDFDILTIVKSKSLADNLDTLRRLAANHDPAFFTVFPLRTKQERDRFDLLRQAYVGARYHDDYKITSQELKYLARCVELLHDQTETSCEAKMTSFV